MSIETTVLVIGVAIVVFCIGMWIGAAYGYQSGYRDGVCAHHHKHDDYYQRGSGK